MKIKIILSISLSLIILLSLPSLGSEYNFNYSNDIKNINKTESHFTDNKSFHIQEETISDNSKNIPSLVFVGIGSVIALSVVVMSIFMEPESLGLNTQTFVTKENIIAEDSQVISVSSLFGLTYNFGKIFEISPGIVFVPQKPVFFLSDFGVKFSDTRVTEKSFYGISPFVSAGITGSASYNSLGYGIYGKAGLILKAENIMINMDIGYRLHEISTTSINSFTIGGNISYKIN